ncbi:ROK family protein [Microbacterium sp. 22195]|uniref:ROK family protein n=1 Tax=Microbacterium sp. 22195 TaxID=3453891 RepID=UPI003F83CE92
MNVLGMDFGGTKVALRVETSEGRSDEARLRIARGEQAHSVLDRAFDCARALAERHGPIGAIGVSTPGIVFEDRVELAPNVIGWSDLELGTRLRDEFGVTALTIENDVKAAALAECREGRLQGVDVGMYVNLGTGIAIAPVIGGAVLRGAHGAAGEVGYGIVGPVRDRGRPTLTLEEFAGGLGLDGRVAASPEVTATDTAGLVAEAAHSDAAARMWAEAVDEIARHLVTAALTVDPSRIAVGGGMTRAGGALLEPLTECLVRALPYPPELVLSDFGPDASLRGAVMLAREGHRPR